MSDGFQDKRKQLRSRDGRARRNRASQERARDAMNAEIQRVYADGDDGEALLAAAAKRSQSVKLQGDPMALTSSRKGKRREAERRESMQRRSENLANLASRKTIDQNMLRAALEIRELVLISTGGMQAVDWIRERVDGGKLPTDIIGGGAYAAESELRHVFRKSGMGDAAAEVVLRVCGMDESLKSVAIDFEHKGSSVAAGKCGRDTQAFVTGLLRTGLEAAFKALFPENQPSEERAYRLLIRAWSAGDETRDMPEIRAQDARFKEAG